MVLWRLTPAPPQLAFSVLLYLCAGLKEFIPGREPPSEAVNRGREKKKQNKTNPKELSPTPVLPPYVPCSNQRSRKVEDKARSWLNTPALAATTFGFGSTSLEAPPEEGAGKEGRKDSWESFVWFLSQVVGV